MSLLTLRRRLLLLLENGKSEQVYTREGENVLLSSLLVVEVCVHFECGMCKYSHDLKESHIITTRVFVCATKKKLSMMGNCRTYINR